MIDKRLLGMHSCRLLIWAAFIIAVQIPLSTCRGNRKETCMNDDIYEIVLKIVKGEFDTPVANRSRVEKSAIINHYRKKDRWSVKEENGVFILLLDGNKVVQQSDKATVVAHMFDKTKGLGARRLQNTLREEFVGLSEPAVQTVLDKSQMKQRLHVKFSNSAPQKSIVSKRVMGRVQVDLIDFTKNSAVYNTHKYQYILTIIDVFSRFCWLRPLKKKSSKEVAKEVEKVFDTFGNPSICQHDRGAEFSGEVANLLQNRDIVDIASSPFHPQSQGKVERSHKILKTKILYDMLKEHESGANWVMALHDYETQLNNMSKEVLGWQTPFEVFFGRRKTLKTNSLERSAKDIRKKARLYTMKINKRNQIRQEKRLRTPRYLVGDEVLVRLKSSGSRFSKTRIVSGKVIKRNLPLYKYKVMYKLKNQSYVKWFFVRDITAINLAMQRERLERSKRPEQDKEQEHCRLDSANEKNTSKSHSENSERNDFSVPMVYNPPGNGNCQFEALAHLLRNLGINTSSTTLRQEVVRHLTLRNFLGQQTEVEWWNALHGETREVYLHRMAQAGVYGDAITLQAVAELHNVQLIIDSTIESGATIVTPTGSSNFSPQLPFIILGHYAERHENQQHMTMEHFVSLRSTLEDAEIIISHAPQITYPLHSAEIDSRSEVIVKRKPQEIKKEPMSSPTFQELPNELKVKILKLAIGECLVTYCRLKEVSAKFSNLVEVHLANTKPVYDLYFRPHLVDTLKLDRNNIVSVRKISKLAGRNSGLMNEIRTLLKMASNWLNAWLWLKSAGFGWYVVETVFWSKK